jgi:hypothetical protein
MAANGFHIPADLLAKLCRKYSVLRLSLFGSVLRSDFGPESDIDMLVEFQPDAQITYFDLAGLEVELTELLGRKVDLRTPAELSRYFREKVLREAKVQYAA